MVRLDNPLGGKTWVHESRLEEYLEMGYTLTPPPMPEKPAKPPRKKSKPKGEN